MLRQFNIIKKLGDGSYGSVYLVKRISDGQCYALKKMKLSKKEKQKQSSLNEIRLLASVQH